MTILYGIKNCDTIKKAKKWLEQENIAYEFHDYRVDGLDPKWLGDIESVLGWEQLLNTRGTTYRKLDEQQKTDMDAQKAIGLMMEYPAMIKRPLLVHQGKHYLGFKADIYAEIFNA